MSTATTPVRLRPSRRRTMPEARTGSERVLRRLEIRRFRGIRGLVLDELPPVTVLTGRNGCGKTSVLEAAFLLCGLSNASLVFSSASFRGLPVVAGADTPFRALLPDLEEGESALVEGATARHAGDGRLALEIVGITAPIGAGPVTEPKARLVGLEFRSRSRSGERKGSVKWEPAPIGPVAPVLELGPMRVESVPGLRSEIPENPDLLPARYLRPHPQAVMGELHGLLNEYVKRQATERVLQLIRLVASSVSVLQPLVERGQPMIYVGIGAKQLFPAQILGGGFMNMLQLAIFMCDDIAELILVDEIEDGLHYSVLPSLADAILAFARQHRKQFLIATHSLDVVRAFAEAAATTPETLAFFKLYRRGEETKAERFDVGQWKDLEEVGGEIR